MTMQIHGGDSIADDYTWLVLAFVFVTVVIGVDIVARTSAIAAHPEVNATQVQADYCYKSPDICDWKPVLVVAWALAIGYVVVSYAANSIK